MRRSGLGKYLGKRLLTINEEDYWGILTLEVKALHDSNLVIKKDIPPKRVKGTIFVSKSLNLLCLTKKIRDPDRLISMVYDQSAGLDPGRLAQELRFSDE
jgi:hypothetical protein